MRSLSYSSSEGEIYEVAEGLLDFSNLKKSLSKAIEKLSVSGL
jgi:CRISPR/Cas system CMR-associated protein Cmr3 (group 5 of RAMP superfamily)